MLATLEILPLHSCTIVRHAFSMFQLSSISGDLLIDPYLPNVDEAREQARQTFLEYARVLENLGESILARDRDSRESGECGRIPPTPPSL